ncbi:MAG: cysteine synthase A [Deltaproteobacteria bacterium]|nr:cysteine synthase A [Deltaproteobacteria bacterium]
MAVFSNILETIGCTWIVRLARVAGAHGAKVYAKLEMQNPGGSVKDRIALAMIEAAEASGALRPGAVVIEATSGNTGIGLALVSAVKGYRAILVMQDSMTLERRAILKAYGAEVVLTRAEDGMEGAVRAALELARATPNSFVPHQFKNRANPAIHRETTAIEIAAALGRCPDAFVAGVGTGGTITGVGEVLKASHPAVRVVAVEPDGCAVLSGDAPGPHKQQGIGAGFVPEVLNRAVIDDIARVKDRDAFDMRVRLAREEGILTGMSGGAAVFAATALASTMDADKTVLTVIPDSGHRYFSLDEFFSEPSRDETKTAD